MMQNDNATNDEPIISDTFTYYKSKDEVVVKLYSECIKLFNIKDKKTHSSVLDADKIYSINDITGCNLGKGRDKTDTKSFLTFYIYPKVSSKQAAERKRLALELAYSKYETYEQNLDAIKDWPIKLHKVLSKDFDVYQASSSLVQYHNRPFLVFVNPVSGAGKAKNIFFERVLPVWSEANVPYQLVLTQYANFAREKIKELNLKDYKGVIVVSGDGLIFEIINGIMEREDWPEMIKTPIGQIPGGSGNALACCVSYLAKEPFKNLSLERFATYMAFLTCKHDVLPMDLVAIEIGGTNECLKTPMPTKLIYSFLITEWAIIADVDLESEKYRFLGGFRFTVGAVKRILNLRIYRGRISFLPVDDCKNYQPKNDKIKILKNEKSNDENTTEITQNEIQNSNRMCFKYLKPFHQPVPDDWVIIEENFVFFLIVQMPLISKDFIAWPDAKLDDGQMLLIFIKEGISKSALIQLFTDTETGNYLQSPYVESVRIKAFRLEPLTSEGNIMIDGEHIPYGPIQGEVMPSATNCIAKRIECA